MNPQHTDMDPQHTDMDPQHTDKATAPRQARVTSMLNARAIPGTQSVPRPADLLLGSVLIADDDPDLRLYVRRGLEDGLEALQRLAGRPVDLVIANAEMPRLDGTELTRVIAGGGVGATARRRHRRRGACSSYTRAAVRPAAALTLDSPAAESATFHIELPRSHEPAQIAGDGSIAVGARPASPAVNPVSSGGVRGGVGELVGWRRKVKRAGPPRRWNNTSRPRTRAKIRLRLPFY